MIFLSQINFTKTKAMIELTPNFNLNNIKKAIQNAANTMDRQVSERLQMVGDEFVANARINGNYKDQTGNLRSSIGYIVFKDGQPIEENFEVAQKGTDQKTGLNTGREFARNYDIPDAGYCLLVVAGMDYAAAVESRGKDVITGSSLIAERELKASFKRLEDKFNKR